MDRALFIAEEGFGFVTPNPPVGCVIVDQNHCFLSEGFHGFHGGPHAEVNALTPLKDPSLLEGATVYTSLEPCAHEGKTPSCAKTLAKYPISKVISALKDPFEKVAGQGFKILKEAGIETEWMASKKSAAQKNMEIFLKITQEKKPFIALKVATSLDGKVALENGESQWITSEEARQYSRELRGRYEATLIGAGTLLSDNPRMDLRNTRYEGRKKNKLILWDPKGVIEDLSSYKIYETLGPENIYVWSSENKASVSSSHFIPWKSFEDSQWQEDFLKKGLHSIFVEGGGYTHSEFLKNALFDKIYVFQAPKILGRGKGWADSLHHSSMDSVSSLSFQEVKPMGADLLLEGYPSH